MKPYWRWLWLALLALIIVILQLGFINSWPFWFDRINLVLLALILFLFFFDFKTSWPLVLIMGFFLDALSFEFFGAYSLTLFFTLLISDFLLINFFTNRSAYSFVALTFFATIFYDFSFYSLVYLSKFLEDKTLFLLTANFWIGLILEIILHTSIIFLFFTIMNLTTNRLKPVFLDKK